jgi:hypothetical protein
MTFCEIVEMDDSRKRFEFDETVVAEFPAHDTCPACATSLSRSERPVSLGGENWTQGIDICVCRNCAHVYYRNPPGENLISEYYRNSYSASLARETPDPVQDSKMVHFLYELGLQDPDLRILDVGCGMGG